MYNTNKQLIEVIKTGKIPQRRNLFKHLFTLAGNADLYDRLIFSDGFDDDKRDSRVVIKCKTLTPLKLINLEKMSEYVTGLRMNFHCERRCVIFLYRRRNVNWRKIDEHTKRRN